MAQCNLASAALGVAKESAIGAGVGALIGAAGGAALGGALGNAGTGAALGAAAGYRRRIKAGSAIRKSYKHAYNNCLRQRGHKVVN